ncbi:hypothetical protein ACIBEJ_00895 [Nonomuraea sp. NPDC050790]|uniref:hypothetical protein n=1 Tax=Nonomuraea sp. NPDC050790 TaxID=3364371 RepID=UPI0037B21282
MIDLTRIRVPSHAAHRYQLQLSAAPANLFYVMLHGGADRVATAAHPVPASQVEETVLALVISLDAKGPEDCPTTHAARAALALADLRSALRLASDDKVTVDSASVLVHLARGAEALTAILDYAGLVTSSHGASTKRGAWGVIANRLSEAHGHLAIASGCLETAADQAGALSGDRSAHA